MRSDPAQGSPETLPGGNVQNAMEITDVKYRLDPEDLSQLVAPSTGWRLSVFLPLEKSTRESRVGSVLLRDLRREVEAELDARLIGHGERARLLEPLDALLESPEAGIFHGDGLAIYASEAYCKTVILPEAPAASVHVDRHFRLEPLYAALAGRDRFYLLCLSLHSIQLWQGDGVSMTRILLGDLETNIKDALHFEDSDSQVQFHSNTGSASRNHSKGQGSTFFGVGGENHEKKPEFLSFFRIIDRGIAARLTDKDIPLILAGVGYLMPIYREANSYPNLSLLELPGATHAVGPVAELHDRASALLREEGRRETLKDLAEYRENVAGERTAAGFTDIVPCAYYKRLTHLFVRKGSRQWGVFHPGDGRTDLLDGYRHGAEDLIDLACVRTLMGGGTVRVVDAAEMPAGSDIAGLCRT
jgi:hypothetical protein